MKSSFGCGATRLTTRRNIEQGASFIEYLLIVSILGLGAIVWSTSDFLFSSHQAAQEFELAMDGGGSQTNNPGDTAIAGVDCLGALANGLWYEFWLEGLCSCGGPADPPCPAFYTENRLHIDKQSSQTPARTPN